MYLQPQCQSHRSISNWVRKSLHHLRSPARTKITRQHHSFKKVWRYLKEMATSWVCWLISNALGTSSSLLGEKLEGNLRVMFKVKKRKKEKPHNCFDLQKIFRSCAQPALPTLPDQCDWSFSAFFPVWPYTQQLPSKNSVRTRQMSRKRPDGSL